MLALGVVWWLPGSNAPTPDPLEFPSESIPATEFDTLLAEEDPDIYIWLADAPVATAAMGPRL